MWQRFTERARQIVFRAQEEARRLGMPYVAPEHLLLGITFVAENMGLRILDTLGLSPLELNDEIETQLPPGDGQLSQELVLTPRAKRVVDLAYEAARDLEHDYIGGEHLLLGILRERESTAAVTLAKHGITLERVTMQLLQLRDSDVRALAGAKPDEELLSLEEAVKFLGTSKPTLYRVLGQGGLKGLKVGRQWRFRKADLVAYMERSPVAVAAAPDADLDTELTFFAEQLAEAGESLPDWEGTTWKPLETEMSLGERKTVQLFQSIAKLAITLRASDIHLEPARFKGMSCSWLRIRVDGVLQETRRMPMSIHEGLVARTKMSADMTVTERRTPQDGRIPVRHKDNDLDFRVSVVPAMYGEAVTMRILNKSAMQIGLDTLGMTPDDLGQIRGLMQQPNGLFIVTGPTGSGKTTTIYNCLEEVARAEVKTLTIEDPVEVQMPYVTQVQVNKRSDVTFTSALRSFLRQDPDIVFVGEVRDQETAQLVVEASLTGHLVLTALHTNDAPSALTRLLEMGLESYIVAATVTGVLAQRLCRKICDDCKEPYQVPARELMRFGLEPHDSDQTITLSRGKGCEKCRNRGYRGRTGLFELLVMTDDLADLIVNHAPLAEIAAAARAAGMNSLWQDGLLKVLDGVTTPDEVLRVCSAF